jgi:hypothetical protein
VKLLKSGKIAKITSSGLIERFHQNRSKCFPPCSNCLAPIGWVNAQSHIRAYEAMPITPMRTRWLTGKQQMHTRPQICFKWNQSPAATWQWIFAQFALVSSLLCPCLFSSTSRKSKRSQ